MSPDGVSLGLKHGWNGFPVVGRSTGWNDSGSAHASPFPDGNWSWTRCIETDRGSHRRRRPMTRVSQSDRTEPARSAAGERPMSTDDIAEAYADVADRVARWGWLERVFSGRFRRRQFSAVEGQVLDVACGAGSNFPYLPPDVHVVGVDISPDMVHQARDELAELPQSGAVGRMDAAALEFDDDSFDTVISSFSTCTFPEPVAALQEMARVCRPDGEIRLLEHGRSDNDLIGGFQNWRADAHYESIGCRWNQKPVDLVRAADLRVETVETALLGIITRVTAHPPA